MPGLEVWGIAAWGVLHPGKEGLGEFVFKERGSGKPSGVKLRKPHQVAKKEEAGGNP